MKPTARFLTFAALIACAASAQAAGGHPGQGGPGGPGGLGGPGGPGVGGPEHGPGPMGVLIRLADADASHDVTADEWAAFLAIVDADGDGVVDLDALVALLPAPPHEPPAGAPSRQEILGVLLDRDGDGTVTVDDLNAFFASLDADADGALSSDELAPPEGGAGHGHDGSPGDGGPPPDAENGDDDGEGRCGQGHEDGRGPRKLAEILARAADADASGDTTTDEWTAFVASLDGDADGVVDLDALVADLPVPANAPADFADRLGRALDHDGDGVVTSDDLGWFFSLLDKDTSGDLSSTELAPAKKLRGKARGAALALIRAADADASHDVTADEWRAFLDGLVVDADGAVSLDDLASKLPAPRRGGGADADTTKRDAALVRAFDRDGDGVVTVSDLQSLFDQIDQDADGALAPHEMHPRH